MLMCLIILCSYGSFFIVFDRMLDGTGHSYLAEYFNEEYIDSVVSIYMIGALGNFTTDRFRRGPEKYYAMFMFLTCTYVVNVLFLNMVICIMSETFSQVLEGSEENGLAEQVELIADHLWLVNIEKIYKGEKYILRIAPSSTTFGGSDDVEVQAIQETTGLLSRKIDDVDDKIAARLEMSMKGTIQQQQN